MRTLGNIIWFILFGVWYGVFSFLLGVIFCLSIIFIPLGIKYFRLCSLAFFPFGKTVSADFEKHPVRNAAWLAFGGIEVAAGAFIAGVILCITIVGIPFAKQYFKIARYAISPCGAEITSPA